MSARIEIDGRIIGANHPPFVIEGAVARPLIRQLQNAG
jgi:hypothetical protein